MHPKRTDSEGKANAMVLCPDCETDMDFEEDEVDEGETVSCTECGAEFEVVSTSALELSKVGDDDDDDDEDEDEDEEE